MDEKINSDYDLNQEIVKRLIAIRQDMGLNQRQFADLIVVSPSVVSRIEHGERELTLNFIQKVSEKTQKSLRDILNIEGNIYNVENQKGLQNQCTNPTLHINLSDKQFEDLKDILK